MPVSTKVLIVGTAYSPVAAGSPGPFDKKMPSGLWLNTSSALAVVGQYRDFAAETGNQAQNVALHAKIEGNDVHF